VSIYQISKIMNRRGKRIDLPQPLSAAEFGWAIDSQELFIGNGSVGEGSPAIGNTKVLTEHDDLMQLLSQYQYKANYSYIQTGSTPNTPVKRSLQDRLDDWVSNLAFGIESDTINQGSALQNAIDTLYANVSSRGYTSSRVVLNFEPGEYNIEIPIYIPSYVTIIGAGIDKTIFKFTGTGKFVFVSDTFNYDISSPDYHTEVAAFTNTKQPRYCELSDFTIRTNISSFSPVMILNCVRNSVFRNIRIKNGLIEESTLPYSDPAGVGIFIYAHQDFSEFKSNVFENVSFDQFKYGIYSHSYFYDNEFNGLSYKNCVKGVQIGHITDDDIDGYDNIDSTSCRNNIFQHNNFTGIHGEGICINTGTKNIVVQNSFEDVGNLLNTHQIYFEESGNYCNGNTFDREDLTLIGATDDFIAPVGGLYEYHYSNSNIIPLVSNGNNITDIFRLPMNDDSNIEVSYILKNSNGTRKGSLFITTTTLDNELQFSDDFSSTNSTIADIVFDATQDTNCIVVSVQHVDITSTLTYTYSILN
jgi:hypothetical protein